MHMNTWLQCFAIDVGVTSTKHSVALPELMSYTVGIIWASEDYSIVSLGSLRCGIPAASSS